jgi:alkanesulfonate monooxygenase SsuD/methylene tetrahydromethanopterin reductase-like flavin-dependent oxidoreductase (luciferase family)
MKNSVKRLLDTLEALDFRAEPHPIKPNTTIHTHAADPDQHIKVWAGMSDAAAACALKLANRIADTGHSGPTIPANIGERMKVTRRRADEDRARQLAASKRLADAKEARLREARQRQFAARQRRGNLNTEDRLAILGSLRGEWIQPLRIIDELCIPDRIVNAAINDETLLAYMHPGRQVMCRISDVKAWVKSLPVAA